MRVASAAMIAGLLFAGAAAAAPMLDPHDGVVLPPQIAPQLLKQCSRAAPSGFQSIWMPDLPQIRDLEARLPAALGSALQKAGASRYAPADYLRQYAGFTVNGRKIIYVNGMLRRGVDNEALPPEFRRDWRHQPVVVCDGGVGYFGVEYDPSTKTFAHLAFNGEA